MPNKNNPLDDMIKRMKEFQSQGLDSHQAFGKAKQEKRIENWPPKWGDNLEIFIYGDFQKPSEKLTIKELGITVYPEQLKNTVIPNSLIVNFSDGF